MVEEMRQEMGYALATVALVVGILLALVGAWQLLAPLLAGGTPSLVTGIGFLLAGAVLAALGLTRRNHLQPEDDNLP